MGGYPGSVKVERVNHLLRRHVRQWRMVKRFPIPPPLRKRSSADKQIVVELSNDTADQARRGLEKAGLLSLQEDICSTWLPYALRTIDKGSSKDVLPTIASQQGFQTIHDWGEGLCQVLSLFYVGKRLGNFRMLLEESGDGSELDGTVLMISSTLEGIADLVGQRAATEIFRKLENATNDVLRQRFGKRDRH